jgi:hypothetical protein
LVHEYAGATFKDARLSSRLVHLATRMAASPSSSFPKALSESELESAYRFFGNERVSASSILEPHVKQTRLRLPEGEIALAVHDTTTLSFRNEGQREGFGSLSGKSQNLWTHATLLVKADGSRCPLGVVALSTETTIRHGRWADHVDEANRLMNAPNRLVHVMDREADDFGLYARLSAAGARFVIRLQHNRRVTENDAVMKISEALSRAAVIAEREVVLGARHTPRGDKNRKIHPQRAARLAALSVASTPITLLRPVERKTKDVVPDQLEMHAVRVWEASPPADEPAVEWTLLTSEPANTPEALLRIVDWYRARWIIEEFFKAMKTGCSIEKRQLESFDAFSNAVAFFAPIAWQLLLLRHRAQHEQNADGEASLPNGMLEVLRHIGRKPLPAMPTAKDVLYAVAALGGHLKRNGPPGWQTLGHGYEKLREATVIWALATRAARSDQS